MVTLKTGYSLTIVTGFALAVGVTGYYLCLYARRKYRDHNELIFKIKSLEKIIVSLQNEIDTIKTRITTDCVDNRLFNESLDDNDEEYFDFPESNNEINQSIQFSSVDLLNSTTKESKDEWSEWIEETDQLLEDTSVDKQQLFDRIKAGEQKFGSTNEILWRLAKASHLLSNVAEKDGDLEQKKALIYQTFEYAEKALNDENGEKSANCHKWYAIACGKMSDYVGTKERIENGQKFGEHVEKALQLAPDDPPLYHLQGRFLFELSNLSWIERKLANTLYAKVPTADYHMALTALLKAYELKPEWKENVHFIAKVYFALGKYAEAIEFINIGLNYETKSEEDQLAQENLLLLQQKCSKYLA